MYRKNYGLQTRFATFVSKYIYTKIWLEIYKLVESTICHQNISFSLKKRQAPKELLQFIVLIFWPKSKSLKEMNSSIFWGVILKIFLSFFGKELEWATRKLKILN